MFYDAVFVPVAARFVVHTCYNVRKLSNAIDSVIVSFFVFNYMPVRRFYRAPSDPLIAPDVFILFTRRCQEHNKGHITVGVHLFDLFF